MFVHSVFLARATVAAAEHHWVASPQPGVAQVMLASVAAR